MPKHLDAVKSFDEFRAPWETEGGTDAEIDKPKLKRYIHGLVTDKAKAQDARDEAAEKVTTLTKERDDAKADAEKASPEEANKKIARLERENGELKTQRDDAQKKLEVTTARAKVLQGVDPKVAKYVVGETEAELEKSLEEVKADFGISDEPKDDDADEDNVTGRTRPRPRLRNVSDPDSKAGADIFDPEKVADDIIGGGIFH